MSTPQLLYGSADGVGGRLRGGWGVLARSPSLDESLEAEIVPLVPVVLPQTVHRYSTLEELQARPVRFRAQPAPVRASVPARYVLWHATEAGTDATGRPGNVVTHAAVVDPQRGLRAIDWYDSPDWLSPWEAAAVAGARLPARLRRPSRSGVAATFEWLDEDRIGRMTAVQWFVDAVIFALRAAPARADEADRQPGQRSLVFRTASAADARGWIGLFLWLFCEVTVERLAFSTSEDAQSIGAVLDSGFRLIGVQDDAALAAAEGRALCVDLSWKPDAARAEVDGHWILPAGDRIPRTQMAEPALNLAWLPADVAERVLLLRDEIGERCRSAMPDVGARLSELALRGALLATPGVVLDDREDAVRLLAPRLPSVMRADPDIAALLAEFGVRESDLAPTREGGRPGPASTNEPLRVGGPPVPSALRLDRGGGDEGASSRLKRAADVATPADGRAIPGRSASPGPDVVSDPAGPSSPATTVEGIEPAGSRSPRRLARPAPSPRASSGASAAPLGPLAPVRPPDDNLLEAHPYPSAASQLSAALVLQRSGIGLETVLTQDWVLEYLPGEDDVRLALLHVVCQCGEVEIQWEALSRVGDEALRRGPFERQAPALLLAGLRAGLDRPAPKSIRNRRWYASLEDWVCDGDLYSLSYLRLYFSPIYLLLNGISDPRETHRRIEAAARDRSSVWAWSSPDGRPLAALVTKASEGR